MGVAELLAGVGAAVLAAQPFAVQKVSASQLGTEPGAAEPFDRLPVQAISGLTLADQRAAAGLDAQCPVSAAGLGRFRELIDRACCQPGIPCAGGGLNQLRQGPR